MGLPYGNGRGLLASTIAADSHNPRKRSRKMLCELYYALCDRNRVCPGVGVRDALKLSCEISIFGSLSSVWTTIIGTNGSGAG